MKSPYGQAMTGYERWLRHLYVSGEIEVWEFEERVGEALRSETEPHAYPAECREWLQAQDHDPESLEYITQRMDEIEPRIEEIVSSYRQAR